MPDPVSDSLTSDGIRALLEALTHWDVPAVDCIAYIDQSHVFRVDAGEAKLVLKDLGTEAPDLLRLEFLRGIHEHVASRGLRVPVLLRSRSGHVCVNSGGRYYCLYDFIEAGGYPDDPRLEGQAFYHAGLAIAELHDALASHNDNDISSRTWREDFAGDLPGWLRTLRSGLPESQASLAARVEQERGNGIVEAVRGLPEQLIHRDCHPGNVLFDGVHVIAFVDCDHFCIGPPLFDLATFAVHFIKWHTEDRNVTAPWIQNRPRLMDGYRSRRELSAQEMYAFPHMMMVYHILVAHYFMTTSNMRSIQTELSALCWIHDNFDQIARALGSSHEDVAASSDEQGA